MIETSPTTATPRLNNVETRAAEAESIAALAREGSSSRSYSADLDGITLERDSVSIAAGARFLGEASALRSAQSNAREAAALAQTADTALKDIAEKLDRLEALATQAESVDLSQQDRSILQQEFEAARVDIDEIAQSAQFNGDEILSGGASPGSAYEVSFSVGSGSEDSDRITLSLDAADVGSLSASLTTADLTTAANATAARSDVDDAINSLNRTRGAVRGAGERAVNADLSAAEGRAASEAAAARESEIQVDIDFARLIGDQIVKEGDLKLADSDAQLLREALIDASLVRSDDARQDKQAESSEPRDKPPRDFPPEFPPEIDDE